MRMRTCSFFHRGSHSFNGFLGWRNGKWNALLRTVELRKRREWLKSNRRMIRSINLTRNIRVEALVTTQSLPNNSINMTAAATSDGSELPRMYGKGSPSGTFQTEVGASEFLVVSTSLMDRSRGAGVRKAGRRS
jgi:hypothetical protein